MTMWTKHIVFFDLHLLSHLYRPNSAGPVLFYNFVYKLKIMLI
jgi:hypothetical protein